MSHPKTQLRPGRAPSPEHNDTIWRENPRGGIHLTSYEILTLAARVLDSKKAEDIKAINIGGVSILADYFLLANGTSTTQVKALADELELKLSGQGVTLLRMEGAQSASWIIMDYGEVVVHIFLRETREFFNLERLWSDGSTLETAELLKTAEGS